MRLFVRRLKSNALLDVIRRLLVLLLFEISCRPPQQSLDVLRFVLEHAVAVVDGSVPFLQLQVGERAVVVAGRVRQVFDASSVVDERFFEVASIESFVSFALLLIGLDNSNILRQV